MPFGVVIGTFSGNAASIGTSIAATLQSGSGVVELGDLVWVVVGEQTAPTMTTVADNLGNTYNPTQVALDSGTVAGRTYWSVVTVPGTITAITATTNGGTNNGVIVANTFGGRFKNAIGANPTMIEDVASPFTCPSSGILTFSDGTTRAMVVAAGVASGNAVWTATSPNTKGSEVASASVLKAVIGYQTVTVTTAVSPAFTGTNPTDDVLGTASFNEDFPGPRWMEPLSSPVRQKIAPAMAIALGASGLISPPMSLPKNLSITAEPGSYTISIADDITFSEDDGSDTIEWLRPLSEPRRLPKGIAAHLQQHLFTNLFSPTAYSLSIEAGGYTISIADEITFSGLGDIDFGWFVKLTEPVRTVPKLNPTNQSFLAYVGASTQNSPNDNFAEQSYFSKYYFQWSEPVRKLRGLGSSLQQSLFVNTFTPTGFSISLEVGNYIISIADEISFSGLTDIDFGWFSPLSEPTRKKPRPNDLSWFTLQAPLNQVNYSITIEAGSYTIAGVDSEFILDNEGWRTQWSEPVRQLRGLKYYLQQMPSAPIGIGSANNFSISLDAGSYIISIADIITFSEDAVFGWYGHLSEPVRQKVGLRRDLQRSFTSDITPLRIDGRIWWLSPWSEPQRQKIGLRHYLQQSFTTDAAPFRTSGRLWWLSQWSEPTRRKPPISPHHYQALAYIGAATQNAPNNNFAEESYFSKYNYPWSEPVRQRAGLRGYLHPFYANDTELIPIPPPNNAWIVPFTEPVRYLEGLKWYLQQSIAYHPRILPNPDVTATMDAIEINEDVALIGISVYDGGVPGAAASAEVSIIEIPADVSLTGAIATAMVSVIEVLPEVASATVSIVEIVAGDGSVSIQEI